MLRCRAQGAYDAQQPLSVNTGIGAPLLSRFDVLLVLRDARDAEWDGQVCDHILASQGHASGGAGGSQVRPCVHTSGARACGRRAADAAGRNCAQGWPLDALRQYIAWAKQTFRPAVSAEAEEVLLAYWRLLRAAAGRQAGRTTVRMLESLVRLAQAPPWGCRTCAPPTTRHPGRGAAASGRRRTRGCWRGRSSRGRTRSWR